ncbi:hypothetical protein [Sorangium cellulosum]|uniref:Uncharacterized protein n=1 Tax=Sorangium cellulosum So0157-2 TaxID=1254432 RepID=S4XSA4_SORCE|nr:hypothetical protein [Sorangium cellulosum]AGP33458.1 hypothetical protein SCE1572_02375 [Sorangium cellulosum So0157-2]
MGSPSRPAPGEGVRRAGWARAELAVVVVQEDDEIFVAGLDPCR